MRCSSPPPTPIAGHSNTYWLIRGYAALRINCNKGSGRYINSSVDHLLSSLRVFAHNTNMNYHQLTKALLLLSCFASDVLAGLLPGGSPGGSGYQYNRPGGFGGPGDLGGFRGRPSTLYGAPGTLDLNVGRSSGTYGAPGTLDLNAGRPSGTYGAPGTLDLNVGRTSSTYGAPGFADARDLSYQGGGGQGGYNRDYGRPQPYSFQYEVYDPPSGNDYSQRESSDGNVVQGEYRVLLPDSRTQIVKYMADDANGYTADVQYEGQAQFSRGGIGSGGGAYGAPSGVYGAPSGTYGAPGGTGGFQGGYQGAGLIGAGASNQYLPPRNNYRK
ncbi:pro-resilin-like isoform X1 [Frieseomelitta varia]|uniref:pro-resilin-like isoform X1 n=1 Tax=Frieseomelitta varia TaxID=561572 RepID=UPI001CB6B4B4|nr:pro-resilin-like isoform X1 [Frieseomelitta varia]